MDLSLRASESAILASNANQSVIANNMANVTTLGFKKVSQQHADFIVPGVQVQGTRADFRTGSLTPTSRNLDVAIEGDGFLQVDLNGTEGYTRAGNLQIDRDGSLVTPQGYKLSPNIVIGNPEGSTVQIQPDGRVLVRDDATGVVSEAGELEAVRFANNQGLVHIGDNIFKEGPNSGSPLTGNFGEEGFPLLRPAFLEESNVDLATEFTDQLVNQRWFQANIRIFQSTDRMLGEAIDLTR